eukprot:TRINITY_DN6483_c0_g1_i1.p2 TRINITY_DN6483_c0_g1~~TRINITY_DN6483_c0_g1_i1.p2  ORF type:complete len:394 (-),score=112.85 TRINITY_DN6483_c0_g1_i1:889-2070(-)
MEDVECLECHEACSQCRGGNITDCLECNKGYLTYPGKSKEGTVVCKKCEEVSVGYYTDINGVCQGNFLLSSVEVCGDGINLGLNECDDGNKLNGDGCSSECKVEEGFTCSRKKGLPDTCVDHRIPQATLTVEKGNILVIDFDKVMESSVNSVLLAMKMHVRIEGTLGECRVTWDLAEDFQAGYRLDRLSIKSYPQCSLQGPAQTYVVTFHNVSLLTSSNGKTLPRNELKAAALRSIYFSETEQAVLSFVGESFSSSSWVTLVLMLGISLFQSVAIQSLWDFINMVQMVSFIPVINCDMPYNLELFLTEYLEIKDLAIPLDFLPDFKYNPLNYVEAFVTDPFSEKFSLAGYQTISFIFNFSNEITTWLLLLLLYFVLKLACAVIPESRYCLLLS